MNSSLQSRSEKPETWINLLGWAVPSKILRTRCFCTLHTLRSAPLPRRARQPLGARSSYSGVLRGHLALEITARASFFSSTTFENTAEALLLHTLRSKSLLSCARQPLGARNHCSGVIRCHCAGDRCSSKLLCIQQHTNTQSQHCFFAHSGRHHCSSMIGNHGDHCLDVNLRHVALEIIARANFFLFYSTSFISSKSLCFELCMASSCALCDSTSTMRCHSKYMCNAGT